MNIALIFAGGTGTRMNNKAKPKQFLEINGKPIIAHTIEHFEEHDNIDEIIVVCVGGWIEHLNRLISRYNLTKVTHVVEGGSSAFESQYKGLKLLYDKYSDEECVVLLHDGVRPLIDEKIISKCISTASCKGSAITVSPVNETIVMVCDGDKIEKTVERGKSKFARAPQCFILNEIYECHLQAQRDNKQFIDSCSMYEYYKKTLFYVEGNPENIKITTPSDYYMAKAIIDLKESSQIFGL